MNRRSGETLFDMVMSLGGMLGIAAIFVLLAETTPLPKLLCFVIGVPVGMIVGWIAMAGIIFVIGTILVSINVLMKARKPTSDSEQHDSSPQTPDVQ